MQADVTKVVQSWPILLIAIPPKHADLTINVIHLQVRQSYAEVTATQKRMERQRQQAEGLVDVCVSYTAMYMNLYWSLEILMWCCLGNKLGMV